VPLGISEQKAHSYVECRMRNINSEDGTAPIASALCAVAGAVMSSLRRARLKQTILIGKDKNIFLGDSARGL